jgi:hypothetical protein
LHVHHLDVLQQFRFGLATSIVYQIVMLLNLHLVVLHLFIVTVITQIVRQMLLYQLVKLLVILSLRRDYFVDFLVQVQEKLVLLHNLVELCFLDFDLAHLRVLQLLVEIDVVGGVVFVLVLIYD